MNINCETILDFYMHKNKKILCQIKVSPTKSRKFKNTCRCLTQEQWNTFDKELEKLINTTDDWNDEKCFKFNIKSYIEVKVQKSKLSLKHFYKCLGAIDECDGEVIEADYVLECLLNFQLEVPFSTFLESQEYEPQTETSPDKLCSPLSYEPYTPSKKKYQAESIDTIKTPGIDYLEYDEDTYSPKPIFQVVDSDPLLTEKIPRYTPAPIRDTRSSIKKSTQRDLPCSSSKESKISSKLDLLGEVIVETEDEIDSPEKTKSLRSKLNKKKSKKREIEYIPKSQEYAVVDVPVYIPTPIEETTHRKVNKTDHDIRKHKKRSMTIDEYPRLLLLDENSREKNITVKEHISGKDKHSRYDNRKIKSRSYTIDEIPSGFSINMEKPKSKNLPEESREKQCKKFESIEKSTSHKSKDKKSDLNVNISSTKEKHKLSEKKPEVIIRASSSSEDEFLAVVAKSKKSSIRKSKASDDDFEDGNKIDKNTKLSQSNDNANNLNISISSATESATDTSLQKLKRGRKQKESGTDDNKSLRRSERSPSKPVRFIEEQHDLLRSKKPIKTKTSPKNKELFGTDDDEYEELFDNNNGTNIKNDKKLKSSVFETPVSKKSTKSASSSSSSSSSTKKKRKRDKSSECEQEKRDMNTWLSKKKTSSSDKDSKQASTSKSSSSSKCRPLKMSKKEKSKNTEVDTESRPKSETHPPSFELPSKEEMELMRNKTKLTQKENAIIRAELDKMRTSPPKEVEILSLQSVPVEDILNTFSKYKSELDEIYENNCKRDYIKGHDGINHCFVIRLLQPNIQMKMLEMLTDVYSNTKSTTQATLYANALLPEWVIRVYMEKFNFSRQQAINQIKAQEAFQLHMEEQSDNSFMFD
ncbi:uncharacterized protein LOC135963294 [Calliphora vicina]|uniref:uncharacterized protein LOC135963294 n=1 Tax=Calliphora vicina TaxID=7373 RepID=UPI00325C2D8B